MVLSHRSARPAVAAGRTAGHQPRWTYGRRAEVCHRRAGWQSGRTPTAAAGPVHSGAGDHCEGRHCTARTSTGRPDGAAATDRQICAGRPLSGSARVADGLAACGTPRSTPRCEGQLSGVCRRRSGCGSRRDRSIPATGPFGFAEKFGRSSRGALSRLLFLHWRAAGRPHS